MTGHPPSGRSFRGLATLLPEAVQPGSEAWRWAAICVRSLRVVMGVTLAVVATGLVGMGVALGLHGLGLLRLDLTQPDPEVLAVGLAVTMIGGAALGLAVEGALRRSRTADTAAWETVAAWAPALLIALWVVERLERLSGSLLPGFSGLFELVPAYLNEVGRRGLMGGMLGLALTWATLEFGSSRYRFIEGNVPALLYACWMSLLIVAYRGGNPIGLPI